MADFGGSKGRIEDRDDEAPCFSFEFFDRDPLHVVEHGSMSLLSEANVFMAHACVSSG